MSLWRGEKKNGIVKNEKVSIEKYYKEIGSLSSCFNNGFKWLYLSSRSNVAGMEKVKFSMVIRKWGWDVQVKNRKF